MSNYQRSLNNIYTLITKFTEGEIVKTLGMNTTWGSKRTGKTTSLNEFNQLKKRLEHEFDLTPDEGKESRADLYLKRLETIKSDLEQRGKKAHSWVKDKALYQKKIDTLGIYIDEVKELIQYKKDHNLSDIDSEIRSIKTRVDNDPDIYKSTAKFFGSAKNVTVVKDIQKATDEFLKKKL